MTASTATDFLLTQPFILAAGQNLPAGAVLGRIGTSQVLTLSETAATDGSAVPYAILVDPVDATAGDTPCRTYMAGEFKITGLTIGAGHTIASLKAVAPHSYIRILSAWAA